MVCPWLHVESHSLLVGDVDFCSTEESKWLPPLQAKEQRETSGVRASASFHFTDQNFDARLTRNHPHASDDDRKYRDTYSI